MTALIMEHDNDARKNANEIIHMMEAITNQLMAEYILTAEDLKDAKEQIKCYRDNDPRPYRIKKRRVPNI